MSRVRRRGGRRRFFRDTRGRPVRYIKILPSLVTLVNGALGFSAILLASKASEIKDGGGYYALSAYMIVLAMFADMLDGRLARMSQSTSSFGGQLDSLCDVISFGVAPAFLMLRLSHQQFAADGLADGALLQRLLLLAALVYMSCAAIRLARFNVENVATTTSHASFAGLPSPAAAGVVVSLVLFHQESMPNLKVILYGLPLATAAAGILMVTRVPYPHVFNRYLRGKKPLSDLVKILVFLGLVVIDPQAALVVVFCGFSATFAVKAVYDRLLHRHAETTDPAAACIPEPHSGSGSCPGSTG